MKPTAPQGVAPSSEHGITFSQHLGEKGYLDLKGTTACMSITSSESDLRLAWGCVGLLALDSFPTWCVAPVNTWCFLAHRPRGEWRPSIHRAFPIGGAWSHFH